MYNLLDGLELADIESKCFDSKCRVRLDGVVGERMDQVISQLTYHFPWSRLSFSTRYNEDEEKAEINLIIKEY